MKTPPTDRPECFFSDPSVVPKLIYDDKEGRAWIKFNEDWRKSSDVWRLDCLQDWIEILQEEYERTHAALRREGK